MASQSVDFLRVIYDPKSQGRQVQNDIVFVHGLNPRDKPNFAVSTWTHESGNFWPEHQLPKLFPEARVLLFSYNSRVGSDVSTNGILQHARVLLERLRGKRMEQGRQPGSCPIIFVAHSVGGLIVKQALVTAKNNGRYRSIRECTKGLMFFAVPHQGGHGASLGAIAKNIVHAINGGACNDMVESLVQNSFFQEHSSENFRHQLEDYRIITVVESRPTTLFGAFGIVNISKVIVDEKSAKLGLSGEREVMLTLDSDHSTVCKFEGDDDKFEVIKNSLGELLEMVEYAEFRDSIDEQFHHILIPRNPDFTGRQEILNGLYESLFAEGSQHRKVAIYGLGGIAKTSIALEIAHRVKEERKQCKVLWISAMSKESIQQNIREILSLVDIPFNIDKQTKPLQAFKRYFSCDLAGEWLIVLDNADNEELLFQTEIEDTKCLLECLPESARGSTLITTRPKDLAVSLASFEVLKVNESEMDAALELLTRLVRSERLLGGRGDRIELLQELVCLPLAITQAAAYIVAKSVSTKRYLEMLRASKESALALLNKGFHDRTRPPSRSDEAVAATWNLSFEQIKRENALAAKYLSLMSFLEPDAIPDSVLPEGENEEAKGSALGVLKSYCMINQLDDGSLYNMHRLVHLVAGVHVQQEGCYIALRDEIVECVARTFPESYHEIIFRRTPYIQHAQKLLLCCSNEGTRSYLESLCQLRTRLGQGLYWMGQLSAGEVLLESAEWLSRNPIIESYSVRINSVRSLAISYIERGRAAKALPILEKDEDKFSRILDESHDGVRALKRVLATAYLQCGNAGKAVTLLRRLIILESTLLPEYDLQRLITQATLGQILCESGELDEAITILEHIVEIASAKFLDTDLFHLTLEYELCRAYTANGDLGQAISRLTHILDARSGPLIPEDDFLRLDIQSMLAHAYMKCGQPERAFVLLECIVYKDGKLAELEYRQESQHRLLEAYLDSGRWDRVAALVGHIGASMKSLMQAASDINALGRVDRFLNRGEGMLKTLDEYYASIP